MVLSQNFREGTEKSHEIEEPVCGPRIEPRPSRLRSRIAD